MGGSDAPIFEGHMKGSDALMSISQEAGMTSVFK
jgi:hypothetical protein